MQFAIDDDGSAKIEENVDDEEDVDEHIDDGEGVRRAVHQVGHAKRQRERDEDDEDHRHGVPGETERRGGHDHEVVIVPDIAPCAHVAAILRHLGVPVLEARLLLVVRLTRLAEDLVVRKLFKEALLLLGLASLLDHRLLRMLLDDGLAQVLDDR